MQTSKNTILITGGATGIGLGLAEKFLMQDNIVIICGRRENRLKEAQEKIPSLNIRVCDVTKVADRLSLVKWVLENFPKLNILINNAGIQHNFDLNSPIDIVAVQEECDTNFIAPIHLSNLFTDHLKKQPESAIMNITSGLAFTPLAFMPVYCATKSALHSFTLSLRYQLSNTSIKVFEIAPPIVDTELDGGARDQRGQHDRGMKPEEFARHAIAAINNDVYEAAIGFAANLRTKREDLFNQLNPKK